MKKKVYLFVVASIFILIAIFIFFIHKDIADNVNNNLNILITIKNNTLTNNGASIIIANNSDKICEFGEEYSLEKKEFGIWRKLKTLRKDIWWSANINELLTGEKYEENISWKDNYGNLKSGKYRLIKIINGERTSVEFTIK